MQVNYHGAQFWFNVLQFLFAAVVALYVRRVAKNEANEGRLKKVENSIDALPTTTDLTTLKDSICANCDDHKKRTAALETSAAAFEVELKHLPTQKQFNRLNESIAGLRGDLQNTQGRLEGINRLADLVNEHLISQGSGNQGSGTAGGIEQLLTILSKQ